MGAPRAKLSQAKLKVLSRAIVDLYQRVTPDEAPSHIVRILKQVLSPDHLAYNEFDPKKQTAFVVPDAGAPDYRHAMPVFENYMLENPLIPALFKDGPLPATRVTDVIEHREYRKTNIFNEFYHKFDTDYQLAAGIDSKKISFAAIALNRKSRDFSEEEVFMLEALRPHLAQVIDIAHAFERSQRSLLKLVERTQAITAGLLCFDGGYRVTHVSARAEELALALFSCQPLTGRLLPAPLKTAAKKILGESSTREIAPAREPLLYTLPDGSLVRVRLAHDPENQNHCLIFEPELSYSRPEQLLPLGLSARQNEVAFWVLQKKTSWEIGRILNLSPRTVEKHIEHIFAKLGVDTRDSLETLIRQRCQH